MNIDDIHITEYGPLSDVSIKPGKFTVVYGKNEDGKSLLLESMLKLFYTATGDRKAFGNMNRVGHDPTGHVFVEREGDRWKYADEAPLEDDFGVSAEDFRNLFVIQDSDVDIAEDDDGEEAYYEEILDEVFNLDTQVINGIQEELRGLGRYTPSGKFTNRQGSGKIRDSVAEGKALINDIQRYQEEGEEAVDLQSELARKKRRLQQLEQEQEELRAAEKRERYEEASEQLSKLEQCKEDYSDVEQFDEEGWEAWNNALNTIEDREEALEEIRDELDRKQNELSDVKEEIEETKQKATAPDRYETLNKELRPVIKNYQSTRDSDDAQVDRDMARSLAKWSATSTGGAVIAAAVLGGLGVPWLPSILGVAAVIGFGATMYFGTTAMSRTSSAGTTEEDVLNEAEDHGVAAETVAEAIDAMNEVEQDKERVEARLSELDKDQTTLEAEIEGLKEDEQGAEKRIEDAKQTIQGLQEEYKLRSIEEYTEKHEEKVELAAEKNEYETRLDQMLDGDDVVAWREEVDGLAAYADQATDTDYDEDRDQAIHEETKELRDDINELEETLGDVKDDLQRFERRANQDVLHGSPKTVSCDFVEDLDNVVETVQAYIDDHEDARDTCQTVESLLDDVEERQKNRLEHLFTGDGSASEVFARITSGGYQAIQFDSDRGMVEVVDDCGERLGVDQLSLGTRDQLYVSVRVSLAKELLDEQTGFFLFDDAFITSDHDRLQRQFQLLEELADEGWQVIYFSAKKEVRELADGAADIVELSTP